MPAKGATMSAEHKKKIGDGNRGKVMSPESRAKMSVAAKGIPKKDICSRGHDLSVNRITKGSRQGFYCRECVRYYKRNNRLKNAFGISIIEYAEMMVLQGDKCAICRGVSPRGKALCVDHNHATGKVRALLCDRCNQTLGHVQESPEILNAMITYLTSWDSQ